MKIRTLKKFVQARMMTNNRWAWFDQAFGKSHAAPDWVGHNDPVLLSILDSMGPAVSPVYECVKVNGGDFVAAFDTLEAAKDLVDKHARGKKAKLMVMHNGEPVLFVEEVA